MSVLLDIDPLSGAIETMDYNENTKTLTIKRVEDVQAVLDANEMVRNDPGQAWRGDDNTMWHVATVPMTELQDWLRIYNLGKPREDRVQSILDPDDGWQTFMYGRLQSSDYYKFKTAPVKF